MDGTYQVTVGDRGRLVLPAEVRERSNLAQGTTLTLVDTPDGLLLLTRQQLLDRVRAQFKGLNLVDELLGDRRRQAEQEDQAEQPE